MPRVAELTVDSIGQRGDGVATLDGQRIFVPLTAPGDRVRAAVEGDRAKMLDLLAPSVHRVAASCAHFADCGGCTLQHVEFGWYLDWKRALVRTALSHAGIDTTVAAVHPVPAGSRRRAAFTARRIGKRLLLGFNERRGKRIVPLTECWVLCPEIVALLPALRDVLADLRTPAAFDVHVAWIDGLDVWLAADLPDDLATHEALAAFAEAADLARLATGVRPEVAIQRRAPAIRLGRRAIVPPPGGFLQASAAAEAWLRDRVLEAVGTARRVVDLYAGCGLLTAPLADRGALALYEIDPAAVAAARAAGLQAEVRDLTRRPLQAGELANVDCVVLDPPRAGAAAQAATLAASAVPRVAYVSCHPGSFARDARTLVDGGFRLEGVAPIDQFRWSAHVELAAVFAR